jgi:hypothetical protein
MIINGIGYNLSVICSYKNADAFAKSTDLDHLYSGMSKEARMKVKTDVFNLCKAKFEANKAKSKV